MATLIPALGSCTARMTAGERRLAQRLEDKLDGNSTLQTDTHTSKKRHTPAAACRGACASAAAAQPPGDTCLPGRPTADPSCAVALTAPFRHLCLPFPTPD